MRPASRKPATPATLLGGVRNGTGFVWYGEAQQKQVLQRAVIGEMEAPFALRRGGPAKIEFV